MNIEIAQFFLCTLEWPYSTIMTMLLSDPFVECMNFAPLTISLHDSRLRYARLSSCKEIVRGAIFMHSPKGSDNNTMFWYFFSHHALPWLADSYPLDWMDFMESGIFGFLMKNWIDLAKKIRVSPKFAFRGHMDSSVRCIIAHSEDLSI